MNLRLQTWTYNQQDFVSFNFNLLTDCQKIPTLLQLMPSSLPQGCVEIKEAYVVVRKLDGLKADDEMQMSMLLFSREFFLQLFIQAYNWSLKLGSSLASVSHEDLGNQLLLPGCTIQPSLGSFHLPSMKAKAALKPDALSPPKIFVALEKTLLHLLCLHSASPLLPVLLLFLL